MSYMPLLTSTSIILPRAFVAASGLAVSFREHLARTPAPQRSHSCSADGPAARHARKPLHETTLHPPQSIGSALVADETD